MPGLSQMPLPPSAAAMAAAQTIMVARAYEAAQARAAAAQATGIFYALNLSSVFHQYI